LPQSSCVDNFPNRGRNAVSDPRILSQIDVIPHQFIEALSAGSNGARGAAPGFDAKGIALLVRQKMRERQQFIRNGSVADRQKSPVTAPAIRFPESPA
jgi:hypothetical protein